MRIVIALSYTPFKIIEALAERVKHRFSGAEWAR